MQITEVDINKILGYKVDEKFTCDTLALSNSTISNTLSFIDDEKYLLEINSNKNITVVISNVEIASNVKNKLVIPTEDARFDFFTLMNEIGKSYYKKRESIINSSAIIHSTAFISDYNVIIGERTIIEPNVTILPDVEIGNDCTIRAGSVIGSEGFEYKRTSKGILPVFHDGKVIIGNKVNIGSLNAIAKGFSFRNTIINDETKTDNLVHIAHAVQIGKRCLLPASCMIAGSATISDDVWIGPNASISSGITIGKNAFITIGSVVVRSVGDTQKVTGNFAIPHDKFLANLKESLKNK